MKKAITIFAAVAFLIVYHYLFDRFSYKETHRKARIECNQLHNDLHRLKKDSAQMHYYFENHQCGDYYDPVDVFIECNY